MVSAKEDLQVVIAQVLADNKDDIAEDVILLLQDSFVKEADWELFLVKFGEFLTNDLKTKTIFIQNNEQVANRLDAMESIARSGSRSPISSSLVDLSDVTVLSTC